MRKWTRVWVPCSRTQGAAAGSTSEWLGLHQPDEGQGSRQAHQRHPERPGRLQWMEGSHLFPMEKPADTAALVLDLLEGMRARG